MISTTLITFSLLVNLITPIKAEENPEVVPKIEVILNELAWCESSNRKKIVNEKDFYSASIGLYQFKIQTFVWAGRKYGLPHNDIFSEEQQRTIAKALILDGRGETHWSLCFKKLKIKI